MIQGLLMIYTHIGPFWTIQFWCHALLLLKRDLLGYSGIRAGSGGCFMGVSELRDTTHLMESRLLLLDSDDPIDSLP